MLSAPPLDDLIALRRALHMEPELSGEEAHTARILENFLVSWQPDRLLTHLGGYGLAAIFGSGKPGPTVLLRADMDAVPVQESNLVAYRSLRDGVAHQCGHDGHMAIVAGLAPLLAAQRPARGQVVLLFQPAEETGKGAKAIVNEPLYQELKPNFCFALHNLPGYPLGQLVCRPGTFAAASVGLVAELQGHPSHAAFPEEGQSPALALAESMQALSSLIPRLQFSEFALLTLVCASLGEASFGVSPGAATLMATLRSFDDPTLERLQAGAAEVIHNIANRYDLRTSVTWQEDYPTTRNTPAGYACVQAAAARLGQEILVPPEPFRWSEDFGWFLREAEGAMFGLGSGENLCLHTHDYDFPEALIEPGIRIFSALLDQALAAPGAMGSAS